jgi:hypothetical protein
MAAIDAMIGMIRMAAHLSFGVLVIAVEQLLTILSVISANPTSMTVTLVNTVVVAQDPANPDIALATLYNQAVGRLAVNGSATFHPSVGLAARLPVESYQVLANITPVQALRESHLAVLRRGSPLHAPGLLIRLGLTLGQRVHLGFDGPKSVRVSRLPREPKVVDVELDEVDPEPGLDECLEAKRVAKAQSRHNSSRASRDVRDGRDGIGGAL